MKKFMLASIVALSAASASAQEIESFTLGGQNYISGLNSSDYRPQGGYRNYHGSYSSGHRQTYRPNYYQSYSGFYNGNHYVPGYSYDPASGWNKLQYNSGSFNFRPGYIPPHLGERIR